MRQLALAASLAAVALTALALAQPPETPGRLTFDDLFEEERSGRRPEQTAWRPDGAALSYLWNAGDGEALWSIDAATGETTRLLAVEELGEEASVDGYHWSPEGDAIAVESGGDLWLLRLDGAGLDGGAGRLTRLTETAAAEEAPTFSPDGARLAYVREADLYVLDLSRATGPGGERALTTDGEPGTTLNATTSWVYWEEIWGRDPTAFWWSPDSTRIAYYRFDETPVGVYTLLEDDRPPYPEPRRQRYPKAGTANPGVAVGVLELATGETVWLDTADPDEETYLARVHWAPDGGIVALERLNREQTELGLLFCDPGGGACRAVLEERHPTWVNLGLETTFLPGGRLLWASERSGWRHLYLYAIPEDRPEGGGSAASGAGETRLELVRQLTDGAWAVTSVDHAGAEELLVSAFGEGPLGAARRRLLRVPLDGDGAPEELTSAGGPGAPAAPPGAPAAGPASPAGAGSGRGWHEALVAPGGRRVLHRWSSADDPGWERLEEVGGAVTAELPYKPPAYDPAALPRWEFFLLPAGDGEEGGLPAARLLPAGAREGGGSGSAGGGGGDPGGAGAARHPVVMYHYGGPGSQVVADRWSSRGRGQWHKLMAERGFGVLTVDNRASMFFGKSGEDRVHRRFGEVNLAAQKAGVEYLKTQGWADASRVGLWGWSGGGTHTLYCLLRSPGTWRSGVAGAPVTDWRYYDTIWTERYLDHPDDNPDGYRDSSPVTHAAGLRDRLLIVHGTADDNVHPQNTLALAQAWVDAGLPFEMAIYPGQTHGIRAAAARHFYEKMTEFFERTLKD